MGASNCSVWPWISEQPGMVQAFYVTRDQVVQRFRLEHAHVLHGVVGIMACMGVVNAYVLRYYIYCKRNICKGGVGDGTSRHIADVQEPR